MVMIKGNKAIQNRANLNRTVERKWFLVLDHPLIIKLNKAKLDTISP